MASTSIRLIVALLLGSACAQLPLRAQLDPRLQACKTDFLDLYQQSTSLKPKPEVVTVFDFSASMGALMYHPLYVNLDRDDSNGSNNNISFTLSGYPGSYKVKATLYGSTVGKRTSYILIKPDGTQVTETDAGTVSPTGVLSGDTAGAADVRNWVRAASHVRFAYKVSTTVTRTVDIPIPWKVTDGASTGNPLSSSTILDQEIKTNLDGTTTTYGSGLQIELDRSYTISGGDDVLSNYSTPTTTSIAFNGGVGMYNTYYIDWLFTGKYTDGSYKGNYIVFDAATAGLAGGQDTAAKVAWGQGYGNAAAGNQIYVPSYDAAGNYLSESLQDAKVNVVPAFTRAQAVKRAAILTWIKNQADVIWAFRFLNPSSEGAPNGTSIHNNSATTMNVAAGVPTTPQSGRDGGWTVLNNTAAQGITATNGNSVVGMKRIATLFTGNSTPLTYATANALAQFNDPNNVFKAVETGNDAPTTCMNHFLIIFTDGNDNNNSGGSNNGNGTTPYVKNLGTSTATVDALGGNQYIIKNTSSIGRNGSYWNLFTYAGIAAHLSDSSLSANAGTDYEAATIQSASSSGTPDKFLPFAIKQRGGVDFGTYGHRITTMTLGVSLGGFYNDDPSTYSVSPKRNLFLAAAVGDPNTTSGLLNTFHAFNPAVDWIPVPSDPADYPAVGQRAPGAIYFFDGTNPDLLAQDLQYAFLAIKGTPNLNSTSNPNLPFIGSSFGKEIYLGRFIPPTSGGVMWSGDLLMFATKEVGNTTVILDHSGNTATALDSTTAQWSALAYLTDSKNHPWYNRTLYTRLPGNASVPAPGLSPFTYTNTSLLNCVASDPNTHPTALSNTAKQQVVQLVSGADLNGPVDAHGVPTNNRANIMGDIVNSSPNAIEYNLSQVQSRLPSNLAGAGNRFRLILTGTNQGWLHAFGEVSKIDGDVDPNGQVYHGPTTGAVAELWAFLPTDFLADLDYLKVGNNLHRFMVDGAPAIYHLDLPVGSGVSGNGVVDSNERAIAIVGLGKGGRSYYALDIHDPFTPALMWALVPDEADLFKNVAPGVDLATVKTVLKKMGFSTCTPALGRIAFKGVLRDAVFFGGGYSTPDVEHNFPVYPNPPSTQSTPLGRSVLAVDVYTGEVLAAVDMTGKASGPVATGLVPFEFFLNSGMAQRAYFQDLNGGLWAWGSMALATTPQNYRIDYSDLAQWTTDGAVGSPAGIRKVAQDNTGKNAIYTTLPAPFRVGSFPGKASDPSLPVPAAVGIASVSGNRFDPLDRSDVKPTQHRLTVVFDRQDSKCMSIDDTKGIQDSDLVGLSLSSPNHEDDSRFRFGDNYYLAPSSSSPKFGYYVNFPGQTSAGFTPKGITAPMVVSGSLFYSYFLPKTADPCSGGTGETDSYLICDVINPVLAYTDSTFACQSGQKYVWTGVASGYMALGTRGVLQGGVIPVSGPVTPGASQTQMALQTLLGKSQARYPKPRVWRTVR